MMATPQYYELTIYQGEELAFWFAVVDPSGVVRNLITDGYSTARLQVRDKPVDQGGVVHLELTTANGGIVLGNPPIDDGTGQLWSGYAYASITTTRNLRNWGRGGYELDIIKDGNPDSGKTLFFGPAVLEQEWTR